MEDEKVDIPCTILLPWFSFEYLALKTLCTCPPVHTLTEEDSCYVLEKGEESFLRISYFQISFSTPEEFQFQTSAWFAMKPIHSYRPVKKCTPPEEKKQISFWSFKGITSEGNTSTARNFLNFTLYLVQLEGRNMWKFFITFPSTLFKEFRIGQIC